jgi:2-C-methyl-D-erythritol 2,4-cyclodiphosphate synthase
LLHAISEALLGSLALGDLGSHFPDTDNANENLDSKKILQFVHDMIKSKHYQINNIDTMIFLEKPKLSNHIKAIRETIAQLLDIAIDRVSVKATTGEKRGLIGTHQMIVCDAVVLVTKWSDEDARNKPRKL